MKLWHLDGTRGQTFQEYSDEVKSLSFSPNNQMLASVSDKGTVKLSRLDGTLVQTLELVQHRWRGRDGKVVQTVQKHTYWVNSIIFSPDGQTLASASVDDTVKLWRLDGTLLQTFEGHSSTVTSISFSPDGETIASASKDGKVILWKFNLKDLLVQACDWLRDYLKTNPNVSESDRHLCDGIGTHK